MQSTRNYWLSLVNFSICLIVCGVITLIFNEPEIRQLLVAHLAGEALRMPSGHHGLDHASDDELA